jgi:hypothetical protein
MTEKKKRAVGRPRLHKETTLLTFRVPVEVATSLQSVLSAIKLVRGERDTPYSLVLIDAFRARLKQLGNQLPEVVAKANRSLDKAENHYKHIKR